MGNRVVQVRGADQKLCTGQTVAQPNNAPALGNQLLIPGAGRLYSMTAFNTNGANRYFQIFDSASVPIDTTVPEVQVKCLPDDDRSVDYGDGILFKNGLYICNSTTSGVKTLGAADALIRAQYRLEATRAASL